MSEKQVFQGENLSCHRKENSIVEICFDHKSSSVNKFDAQTLQDLQGAVSSIQKESGVRGLLLTSKKDTFIVGADITEFLQHFKASDDEMKTWLKGIHKTFNDIEDFPFPTVAVINGICLGGGFEVALTCNYRIASTNAKLGLPETKLGIFPGWGGTVRFPRLVGADNAIEWIASGETYKPEEALKIAAIDAIVAPGDLLETSYQFLEQVIKGDFDWKKKSEEKKSPLHLITPIEKTMVFEGAKGFIAQKTQGNYPSPLEALQVMKDGAGLRRDEAIPLEINGFVKMAKSSVAENLVTIFLSDQFIKKKSKDVSKVANPVKYAAVCGAGIMGGGIAYQSACRGVPIFMKDIQPKALSLGLEEAGKLLAKQAERGKMDSGSIAKIMGSISPTLSYGDFKIVDVVVEAVVENEKVKQAVLAELESAVREDTILSSNTSTISINRLASNLKRPQNFCGMHFFNPVHRMPLVEVIRGEKSSDQAIATVVNYAMQMGKTPIVVRDCAGFLVNRILFPYFSGLVNLLEDGVEFKRIDKVMERFGWPMGPAYLLDVIGMDTAVHAGNIMAQAFPDRMSYQRKTPMAALVENQRLGQKNGKGFYQYTLDKKGKMNKIDDPQAIQLMNSLVRGKKDVSDQEIVERMMFPMIHEGVLCLMDKIVDTPMEVDLGMLYGLGFPPFRGGIIKYLDTIGLDYYSQKTKTYLPLGPSYNSPALVEDYAKKHRKFYTA